MEKLRHDILHKYPLLCLTRKRNNLLMWAHYTDSHRGFVMGFDGRHPFFNQKPPRKFSPLLEVEYADERFMVPETSEFYGEKVRKVMLLKSSHWSYEEELRMIGHPQAADLTLPVKGGEEIYLYKFPPESLREVIFGQRMNKATKQKIAELVKSKYLYAEVFEARLNPTMYELDIVSYVPN